MSFHLQITSLGDDLGKTDSHLKKWITNPSDGAAAINLLSTLSACTTRRPVNLEKCDICTSGVGGSQ